MLVHIKNHLTPENLTNYILQTIGNEYIKIYGQNPKNWFHSLFHNNHQIAKKLARYNNNSDVDVKWKLLVRIYAKLPNNNGEIATTIRQLFNAAFKQKICIVENYCIDILGINFSTPKSTDEVSRQLNSILEQYFLENPLEPSIVFISPLRKSI